MWPPFTNTHKCPHIHRSFLNLFIKSCFIPPLGQDHYTKYVPAHMLLGIGLFESAPLINFWKGTVGFLPLKNKNWILLNWSAYFNWSVQFAFRNCIRWVCPVQWTKVNLCLLKKYITYYLSYLWSSLVNWKLKLLFPPSGKKPLCKNQVVVFFSDTFIQVFNKYLLRVRYVSRLRLGAEN